MYVFTPGLKIVQRQLDRYDEEIILHFKLKNIAASRKSRGLFYVRRPSELEGVAVWMGQHIVLLPPDGRDITFYDRIAPLIGRTENISLQGTPTTGRPNPSTRSMSRPSTHRSRSRLPPTFVS